MLVTVRFLRTYLKKPIDPKNCHPLINANQRGQFLPFFGSIVFIEYVLEKRSLDSGHKNPQNTFLTKKPQFCKEKNRFRGQTFPSAGKDC